MDEDFIGYPPLGEPIKGIEAHLKYGEATHAAFSDLVMETEEMIAEGDKVVAVGYWNATHTGEFMGYKGTGKRARWKVISVYGFNKDGKLTSGKILTDTMSLFQQLGITPPNS